MSKIFPGFFMALICTGLATTPLRGELLSKERLATCTMHAIGIYSPLDHFKDDRVYVDVTVTDQPMVLVLSSYFGTQWNLNVAEGVDLRQIIVPGYSEQEIVGAPEGVPIEMITWFAKEKQEKRKDYFYAHALETHDGRKFRSRLLEMTGLPLTTFQGSNQARNLIVDGSKGFLTLASRKTLDAESMTAETSNYPLAVIESEAIKLAGEIKGGASTPAQKERLEKLVRKSFALQTKAYRVRLEAAKANLELVQQQLNQREKNEEPIISKRMKELLEDIVTETVDSEMIDPEIAAETLASEGWKLWMAQDYSGALSKFEKSVELDGKSSSARNGLGWSQFNLRRPKAAVSTFRDLLADEPEHGAARNGLGQSLLVLGKLDEAKEQFLIAVNEAIETLGEERAAKMDLAAWGGLVQTLDKLGESEKAIEWAKRSLAHQENEFMTRMVKEMESRSEPDVE